MALKMCIVARVLVILAGWGATILPALAKSGTIVPIGALHVCESTRGFGMVLRNDADEVVGELDLSAVDDTVAGALLTVSGLVQNGFATIEPFGSTTGSASLYRGDRLLVLQPPRLGETDVWLCRIHVPTGDPHVTVMIAEAIVKVEHRRNDDACADAISTFAPGLIVVRLRPGTEMPWESLPCEW
jgi:hypothetical protein